MRNDDSEKYTEIKHEIPVYTEPRRMVRFQVSYGDDVFIDEDWDGNLRTLQD